MRLNIDGRFLLQDVTGVQKVAVELVQALDVMLAEGSLPDLEVVVLAPRRGTLVTDPDYKAIELRRAGRWSGHAWEQLELPRLVGSDPLLCLGNLAPLALLITGRTAVHTMVHDLSYRYFPQAYSRAFRAVYGVLVPLALSRSRTVFTVSQSERAAILQQHPRLIGPDRLVAVQNGGGEGAALAWPSDDPASRETGVPQVPSRRARDARCLYVGSLTLRKNSSGLARAAIELVRTTDLDVVFVGATGASFGETGMTIPDELAGRVHFLGQVNDPERIEAEYRRASVFLFPSHYEASPLPPVEAMRFGCPVVSADIPSLRERCGEAVLYCDPHDVTTMVAQVRRVTEDPAEWERLQAAGLEQAARFSWLAQARTVLDRVTVTT